MVWDLRGALLKKEEFESARLQNFDFRQRARTMRLLAAELGDDPQSLAVQIAEQDDDAILSALAHRTGRSPAALGQLYRECQAEARRQLIIEIGDPTPHRLG